MSQLFTNNAATVLASPKAAGATTMVVQAGTGARFPTLAAGDFFELTLFKIVDGLEAAYEIVKVTARSIDTFTIVGAQGGTTPTAFGVGDQVSLRVTASWLNKATTDIESKAPLVNPTFTGTVSGVSKAMVGLPNVDNTSDASKPVSTAQQAALDLKASLANPTFTGTVSGVSKAMVGLPNVDNTSDVNKPVSTAQQNALNQKADTTAVPAIVKSNLTGYKSMTGLTASRAITAADVGTFIYCYQSFFTITLPRPDAIGAKLGDRIVFITIKGDGASSEITLVPMLANGATLFAQSALSSLAVYTGQQVELVSDGGNTWQVGMTTARINDNAEIAQKAPINNAVLTGTTQGSRFQAPMITTGVADSAQSTLRAPPANGVAGVGNEVASMGVASIPGTSYGGRYFWETIPAAQVSGGNLLYKQSYSMNLRATDVSDNAITPPLITARGNGAIEIPGSLAVGNWATVPTPAAQANTTNIVNAAWVNRRGVAYQPVTGIGLSGAYTFTASMLGHWGQFMSGGCVLTIGSAFDSAAYIGATFTVKASFAGTVSFPGAGVVLPDAVSPVASYVVKKGEVVTFTCNGTGWYVTAVGVSPAVMDSTYAPIANPTFTGTVSGVSKAMVGLPNVDNTSDASKPVSAAQQAALDLKANFGMLGLRNRIINGDMRIAQRGVAGTITGGYTLDRWILSSTGAVPSWSQQRTTSSVIKDYAFDALSWPGVAGNTGITALQRIESINCADLAGGKVSLSFWVFQSTGQSQSITPSLVYSGGAADSWGSQIAIPALDPAVIVPSGVWTKVANRFDVPTAAITGLGVYPWGTAIAFGAGSAGYLSKVQLEPGDVVTPFAVMPVALQLLNCQRYYERIGSVGAEGYATGGTGLAAIVPFKVQKRAIPTMGSGTATFVNCTFGEISGVSTDLARVRANGAVAGNAAFTINITAESEL